MKEIKNITVKTLKNGYSLEFDGMQQKNGYMYFDTASLLEGFMMHIGLNFNTQLNIEDMKEFILTANRWNDNEKNVTEIKRLEELCERYESGMRSRQREILKMRNKMSEVLDLVKTALKTKDKDETKMSLQNAVRVIGNVKALSAKEREALETEENETEKEEDNE